MPKKKVLTFVAPLVPLLSIAAIWYFADLSSLTSPEQVAELARALRESPLGLLYVLCAFAVGTALFFPVTALILGTTLAFDPTRGFAYSFLGALLGASITYWGGRLTGGRALDYANGPRIARFREELRTHAFRASIIARLLPVGNFTVINLLAGGLRVPFRAFFFGNVIGILPGVLLFTFFAGGISSILQSPSRGNIALFVGGGIVILALLLLLKRWMSRRVALETSESTSS